MLRLDEYSEADSTDFLSLLITLSRYMTWYKMPPVCSIKHFDMLFSLSLCRLVSEVCAHKAKCSFIFLSFVRPSFIEQLNEKCNFNFRFKC